MTEQKKENRKEKWKQRLAALVLILAVLIPFLVWSNDSIVVSEYTYTNEQIPAAFDGLRIMQISDLHNKMCGDNQSYLMSRVQEAEPDIIVITGDLIDYSNDGARTSVADAMCFVEQAVQIAPVYYVNGNHEQGALLEYPQLREQMIRCDVVVLEDESVMMHRGGASIRIAGFENCYSVTEMQEMLMPEEKEFVLLLNHNPVMFDEMAETNADLALCGHAHGGQFRLPFVGGLYAPDQGFLPEYTEGAHQKGDFTMVVSRGIGNSGFPVRLFNRPEIVVVTLDAAEE